MGLQYLQQICSKNNAEYVHIIENGVLRNLIKIATKHVKEADLMETTCHFTAAVATNHYGTHLSMIKEGLCNIVFTATFRHLKSEQVISAALAALKLLSCYYECWCDADGTDRIQQVTDAITAHQGCEDIQMNGVATSMKISI